jgi:HEPN domain-containing protein
MSATDSDILAKVKQWLDYGDEDLCLAKYAMEHPKKPPYRLAAYHAQQCAEKNLKAFLVYSRTDFPFTHNLSRLIELCQRIQEWPVSILDAEELTPYAITARYPGEDRPVTREEAERAIQIAENTRNLISKALTKIAGS